MGILNSKESSAETEFIIETYEASAEAMYKHAMEDPAGYLRILGNIVGAVMELRESEALDATHKAALDAVAIILFEFAGMTLESFDGIKKDADSFN